MSRSNPLAEGLAARIAFILTQAGVKPQEHDQALAWAFGPDAWEIAPSEWPARWNHLHPNAFHATGKDRFVEFVFVCGYYYVQEQARAALRRKR